MYRQKISIEIPVGADRGDAENLLWSVLGSLYQCGQIEKEHDDPFIDGGRMVCFVSTIEKGSLARKYSSEYVILNTKELEQFCSHKVKTEFVAAYTPGVRHHCTCKRSEYYILFTHMFHKSSPLECGSCSRRVPIYKLDSFMHGDIHKLLKWVNNYKACDTLQLNSTVGEQWATKQMSDHRSQLSKEGIALCQKINAVSGRNTYYYLFNYRNTTLQQDKDRPCPSCGGKWLVDDDPKVFYNFRCDKCCLISALTCNAR